MFPRPRSDLKPNTPDFEVLPHIVPTGFREYDARWRYPDEINLMGFQALGLGLGTLLRERGVRPAIVVAHDYRSYSGALKNALIAGLMSAGCEVHDIGLGITPMAYFAQFDLDVPAVAMVTASHNANGWTGVKMGMERPLTFGPDDMSRLKEIVLRGAWRAAPGGSYLFVPDMIERYIADLTSAQRLAHPIKVVAACGNGTAGLFAERVLTGIGANVVPLDCELDYTFPKHNPNPEDLGMLHALADTVKASGADIGLAFDGDGDRCGVVDDEGEAIFADKVGVMIARDLSAQHKDAQFVVDVKSTGLFHADPVLHANGARTEYWKTGHSYLKRRAHELKALAAFEKSGHYFFRAPLGRGYDDGFVSAIAILQMLGRAAPQRMSDLRRALPTTYGSPTMSPACADTEKYSVVERVTEEYLALATDGGRILGEHISEIVTVNGVRVTLEDGTWGLVRASSNTPNLVVVVESPVSAERMKAMFDDVDARLKKHPEIGDYDQKI
jgi:phosphomannomutase/phosphoglucomutase